MRKNIFFSKAFKYILYVLKVYHKSKQKIHRRRNSYSLLFMFEYKTYFSLKKKLVCKELPMSFVPLRFHGAVSASDGAQYVCESFPFIQIQILYIFQSGLWLNFFKDFRRSDQTYKWTFVFICRTKERQITTIKLNTLSLALTFKLLDHHGILKILHILILVPNTLRLSFATHFVQGCC